MRKRGGDVVKISELFEKYKKTLKAPQKTVINVFQEVVKDILSFDIPFEKIQYSPNTKVLFVGMHGPGKSEVLLHKDEILLHMKGRLGEKSAPLDVV